MVAPLFAHIVEMGGLIVMIAVGAVLQPAMVTKKSVSRIEAGALLGIYALNLFILWPS